MAASPYDLGLHRLGFVDPGRLAELVEESFYFAVRAVGLRDDEQAIEVADRAGAAHIVPALWFAAPFDDLHEALCPLIVLSRIHYGGSGAGCPRRVQSRLFVPARPRPAEQVAAIVDARLQLVFGVVGRRDQD